MASNINQTAWICRNEFDSVHRCLFSDEKLDQTWAVDRIAAWKCRLPNRLPASVEMTGDLVRTKVSVESGLNSNHEQRMLLSTTIIRFINVITDCVRNKQISKPVHVLAKEVALPEWIVNLRHEATHGSLPDLWLLRQALTYCLEWIQVNYWQVVGGEECCAVLLPVGGDVLARVSSVLIWYEQHMFSDGDSERESTCVSTRLKQCLTNTESNSTLLHLLSQPGYLPMTEEQLKALGITSQNTELPIADFHKLVNFWAPLLHAVHGHELTTGLLEALIQTINTQAQAGHTSTTTFTLLVEWVVTIITALHSQESEFLLRPMVDINWLQMLSLLFRCPHRHSLYLLKSIKKFVLGDVSKKQLSDIRHLLHSYQGDGDGEGEVMRWDPHLKTIHDLEQKPRICGEDDNKWTLCTDISLFHHCAIGLSEEMLASGSDIGNYLDMATLAEDCTSHPRATTLPVESSPPEPCEPQERTSVLHDYIGENIQIIADGIKIIE